MKPTNPLAAAVVSVAALCCCTPTVLGQEVDSTVPLAWTRRDAIQQLQLHPRDPYLQFVLMQLSTTPGQRVEAGHYLPRPIDRRQVAARRSQRVDLYSIFSGSLAVQESLQLDAMTRADADDDDEKSVAVESLTGPTVQSHPWQELLASQTPKVSELAACVPDDQLFLRFQSVNKLMRMRKLLDETYVYAAGNLRGNTSSAGVMDRLQQQWLIETNDLLMPLYDVAVSELAITSSDLFFREGTDATLILRLNQPQLIRSQLDRMLTSAANNDSSATLQEGSFGGVAFKHVTTPDRSVHVYVADPTSNLHVRSNSKVAFERVMQTILGKSSNLPERQSLAQTDEFRYIRTLMPLGAEEEDGFVYLSDPFIRNLIGPEKKLTQRHRLVCRSRLQMLDHAQLLFQTQFGRTAESIDELRQNACLGTRDKPIHLVCPGDGRYGIGPGRIQSHCSHHGNKQSMIPCCEIPVTRVSPSQSAEYKRFVTNYSRYWQTFFDPIAVRIQLQPKKTRIETIVLPLINNSIYRGLAQTLGGQPESLDRLPVPERNIFSVAFKLDKDRLLDEWGIPDPEPKPEPDEKQDRPPSLVGEVEQTLLRLGLALHNYHSAYKHLPPRDLGGVKSGLSWRVHLLPFMEEQALYGQFKLDEPWDSEHNRKLISQIPDVFAVASPELAAEGKTRFVFPEHPDAIYRSTERGARFRETLDGLSNTILAIVADQDRAVVWTRPEDLPIDLAKPRQGWSNGVDDIVSLLMADGAVVRLPNSLADESVGHLLTRAGKERIDFELPRGSATFSSRRRRGPFFLSNERAKELVDELGLAQFLHNGIGSQVSLHVCDGDPLVDLNVARLVGMMTGGLTRGFGAFNLQTAAIGMLAASFNSPVYASIPVEDPEIVDRTLEKLDLLLARLARSPFDELGGFLRIEQDYYQRHGHSDPPARAYAFRLGPITWRFYWARIDNGLYIASKPYLIEDLRAAAQQASAAQQPNTGDATFEPTEVGGTEVGHGMVRVRPLHWNEIKPHFRIGWAESERRACLDQLVTLAYATRALQVENSADVDDTLVSGATRLAQSVFQRRFGCPGNGTYSSEQDGKAVRCTVHGTVEQPRQLLHGKLGRIAKFAESLRDVRMDMTFLEDGLHAVVTLETK